MQVRRKGSEDWETIKLSRNIYAVVCINLQASAVVAESWTRRSLHRID